ncbi:c-type cytochrome [Polaromonas sp. YR568]|uniref:c-type cytochrome n=1 Tax=Polaromonas sp. YR568 TaxID=1855301 RepID=UPI00398BEFC6
MGKSAIALATFAALLGAALAGAGVVVYGGVYDVSASSQHLQAVHSLLETTMQHSVRWRARNIATPPLDDAQRLVRGAALFRDHCVQCHGAPGVAQADIGKSMQPVPGPLVDALQRWRPREIYWITRHGIKMSGMPAWQFRLDEEALWDVAAFVQLLPTLSPQAYAQATAQTAAAPGRAPGVAPNRSGDAERGRLALAQYACQACHTIPGITSSSPNVGPPLQGLASRSLIAGKLANTPDNLVGWIRQPKNVKPLTAMPDMGVSEGDARDMAAYLATLR